MTLVLIAPPPAGAATACAEQVIHDWSEDGRVDGVYELSCYQEAVDAIPSDLRDYTNAAEVIERALTVAVRTGSGGRTASTAQRADSTSDGSGVPLAPVGGAVFALGLVLAGGAAYALRRRRAR
jgi:hypothetical protein